MSPTVAVETSAVFVSVRSLAIASMETVLASLDVVGSWIALAVIVAVLSIGASEVTLAVMVRVRVAPLAMVPTVQMPVVSSYAPAPLSLT